jgi:hypothetical protein
MDRAEKIAMVIAISITWLFLIPIWIVCVNAIGQVDETTGITIGNWTLIAPIICTLVSVIGTIKIYRKIR